MRINIPRDHFRYMKPVRELAKQRPYRDSFTVNEFNTLVVTPELLAQPRLKPEPPADVIRVIDNAAEGGGSHE